jgi:hypothetical protein
MLKLTLKDVHEQSVSHFENGRNFTNFRNIVGTF